MVRDLHKQLKLKQLILDEFVPPPEVAKIEARTIWDDEAESWLLRGVEVCGNRLRVRRPASSLAAAITDRKPLGAPACGELLEDNLLQLELEVPERGGERY